MTKAPNIASIEHATGKSWERWVQFLDSHDARNLNHTEIAKLVHESLDIESAGWWSQGVTVAYEQHIGRRAAGQRSDGTFESSATKTVSGSRDAVFAVLQKTLASLEDVHGQAVENVRTSITPVRSYWRCDLANDNKVTVAVESREIGKVLISVVQSNMKSAENSDKAKEYWKQLLSELKL